ncbi:MAG: fumarylacetoacetate hydrolase family protein [Rhodobacteraceae bacterium]|jgi:2,4-diketo-3-deoxy-L-fuconate hydrolase|nr:fumarylacetoacetate hydrolase family protein [Paracoccaceae bacterium]MBL4557177.1 fumarylacetoacetate hydrolase family protein [Paracoccaceae bacterium]HBG97579.1 2-hydroxyhepta-2,4-diene-1,7-dioate isomerase [Paracoccaceae bacterium]
MRFLRYGPAGAEKPGVLDDQGRIRDLSGVIPDLAGAVLTRLDSVVGDIAELPVVAGAPRLGPPVAGTGKMLCIGLNYTDHAAETGAKPPREPILFMKATSAIQGPDDPIVLPRGATATDWEVELGVVIGRPAKHVPEDRALDHVAGYCVVNDVSERDFQKHRGGQWTKGKSCDSFGPVGPWLVTPDEAGDPQTLALWCEVNGDRRQNGSTADMIFGVSHLIAYLSDFMTLHPGDIIATGTPAGVALGMAEPAFLKPGDRLRLGVAGLGEQNAQIVAPH